MRGWRRWRATSVASDLVRILWRGWKRVAVVEQLGRGRRRALRVAAPWREAEPARAPAARGALHQLRGKRSRLRARRLAPRAASRCCGFSALRTRCACTQSHPKVPARARLLRHPAAAPPARERRLGRDAHAVDVRQAPVPAGKRARGSGECGASILPLSCSRSHAQPRARPPRPLAPSPACWKVSMASSHALTLPLACASTTLARLMATWIVACARSLKVGAAAAAARARAAAEAGRRRSPCSAGRAHASGRSGR